MGIVIDSDIHSVHSKASNYLFWFILQYLLITDEEGDENEDEYEDKDGDEHTDEDWHEYEDIDADRGENLDVNVDEYKSKS